MQKITNIYLKACVFLTIIRNVRHYNNNDPDHLHKRFCKSLLYIYIYLIGCYILNPLYVFIAVSCCMLLIVALFDFSNCLIVNTNIITVVGRLPLGCVCDVIIVQLRVWTELLDRSWGTPPPPR